MLTVRGTSQINNSLRNVASNRDALALSVAQMGAPLPYARDLEIYGEGEEADYAYQVVSGVVRTYKILSDGRRQIGSFYLSGDIFGLEIGRKHTLSAEAVCDCTIAVIKLRSLVTLARSNSNITEALWTVTAHELERAQKHVLLLVRSAPRTSCVIFVGNGGPNGGGWYGSTSDVSPRYR